MCLLVNTISIISHICIIVSILLIFCIFIFADIIGLDKDDCIINSTIVACLGISAYLILNVIKSWCN